MCQSSFYALGFFSAISCPPLADIIDVADVRYDASLRQEHLECQKNLRFLNGREVLNVECSGRGIWHQEHSSCQERYLTKLVSLGRSLKGPFFKLLDATKGSCLKPGQGSVKRHWELSKHKLVKRLCLLEAAATPSAGEVGQAIRSTLRPLVHKLFGHLIMMLF